MEDKKRLGINLIAQLFAFAVGFIINFFLAPFVIDKLGTEAYGFIGLANNFVSYTTLITIALNSMAARFITISFHKGDIVSAKKYFASVYYSNLFLAIIIVLFAVFIVGFLNYIINIPPQLEWDIKFLFALTFLNSIVALTSNVYAVATFVKNRLDLSSLRNIISNLLRVLCILTAFLLFTPHLWYYGISALVATTFVAITNRALTKKLLPDFKINRSLYDFKLVKELIFSGGWNLINQLSEILSTGLNLLLANFFIGALAMSILSISNAVPIIILSLCASISAVFIPKLTEFYAQNRIDILQNELKNNIRIMGVLSAIPMIIFIVLGEEFFHLWIPTQNVHLLYILSLVTIIEMLIAMPMESIWNIFTITNRVKISSLIILVFSILIFLTILIGVSYFDDEYHKLLSIVTANFIWKVLRSTTFLPIFGARCLGLKWNTFYPIVFKNLCLSVIIIVIFLILKRYFTIDTWLSFCLYAIIMSIITFTFMGSLTLTKSQKSKLYQLVKTRLKNF